ncbi:MAG: hypothetical protein HUU60_09485 [Armatimonadetes bacterium]|nr:hypothetical protein [Armatimonadota bacterium]
MLRLMAAVCAVLAVAGLCMAQDVRRVNVGPNFSFRFVDSVTNTGISRIKAGDTVRWVWISGSHTITSDTGLFNTSFNSTSPPFNFQFNVPGQYSYRCQPHFSFGMVGTVIVLPRGDVDGNGCVDDVDLALILQRFGESCAGCGEDLNRDGIVDDVDLAIVLTEFGVGC